MFKLPDVYVNLKSIKVSDLSSSTSLNIVGLRSKNIMFDPYLVLLLYSFVFFNLHNELHTYR